MLLILLLPFFSFLFVFVKNASYTHKNNNAANNKPWSTAAEKSENDSFTVSEINFVVQPIGLFQKGVVNIRLHSEPNFSDECLFEAHLQFLQPLGSLNIFQMRPITIVRKVLRAMQRIQFEFECWHFTAPGFYRLSLLRNKGNVGEELSTNFVVASSEWVQINSPPNSAIHLHLPPVGAIFPFCQNAFSIRWTLPNCDKAKELLDFRLRLLASLNDGKANELLYLEEFLLTASSDEGKLPLHKLLIDFRAANASTNSFPIPCTKFDIIHEQFCFELISINRQTQQHQLWDRKCMRTEATGTQTTDGGHWEWGEWSEWAKCSCKRNEAVGSRKRMRHCRRSTANLVERTTVESTTKAKVPFGEGGGCRGGQIMQREKCHQRQCPNSVEDSAIVTPSSLGIGQLMPNLSSSSAAEDICTASQCFCGGTLPKQPQGMFFASLCPKKSAETWKLEFGKPFRAKIILSDRLMDDGLLAFEVIRDNGEEEKEAIWRSSQNTGRDKSENVMIEGLFGRSALFELRSAIGMNGGERIEIGGHGKGQKRKGIGGVLVEYKLIAFEEISTNLFAELLSADTNVSLVGKLCSEEGEESARCSILLGLCSLFIVFAAVCVPPFVFVCLAKRYSMNRLAKHFPKIYFTEENNSCAPTHCPDQIANELVQSGATDSTKLSNSLINSAKERSPLPIEVHRMIDRNGGIKTVEQRSIGIQLSRHSTPRCAPHQFASRQRRCSSNCNGHPTSADHASVESTSSGEDSNLVQDYWNEDDDFGAEQLQLGGDEHFERRVNPR